MRFLHIAYLGSFAVASPVVAYPQQVPASACAYTPSSWEDPSYELWPDDEWQDNYRTLIRGPDHIMKRLVGTYRLIQVYTEGRSTRGATEWQLTLAASPSDSSRAWQDQYAGVRSGTIAFPVLGFMDSVADVILPNTVHRARDRTRQPVRGTIWIPRQAITLTAGPYDALDAGTLFHVFAVDSLGNFRGRWEDGGTLILGLDSPYGLLEEHPSGYFCAKRLSD